MLVSGSGMKPVSRGIETITASFDTGSTLTTRIVSVSESSRPGAASTPSRRKLIRSVPSHSYVGSLIGACGAAPPPIAPTTGVVPPEKTSSRAALNELMTQPA
jgi:hypothetical protein